MKKFLFLGLLATLFVLNACKDDDPTTEPDYQVTITSPDATDKTIGETLHINIKFEDKNDGIVHHINVRIYEKDSGAEIYNKPAEEHVHASKSYIFEDDLALATAGTWVLEAKVWGEDDGTFEVANSVEFQVN